MPYDVTIITVKPNTHSKALPPLEAWLKANPRKGEFMPASRRRLGISTRSCCCITTRTTPISPPTATRWPKTQTLTAVST